MTHTLFLQHANHPYRILIIGDFGSGKNNALLNLIKERDDDNLIDKIYLHAKDLNKPKYQFLIKKREDVGIKHLNDQKSFIEYSHLWMMFPIILMITIQEG